MTSERERIKGMALSAVKHLLVDESHQLRLPDGCKMMIQNFREGGSSFSEDKITISCSFEIEINQESTTLLEEAFKEAQQIADRYATRARELKEKIEKKKRK